MPYHFAPGVDPRKLCDPKDSCPPGWDTVIEDAQDRSKQFNGYRPIHLVPYIEWEERELERIKKAACPA
jgi:hypothetical protein